MKRLFFSLLVLITHFYVYAQLPNRVKKLEGLWEYKEGSGYERWTLNGDVMQGESFRVNKLGDTTVAERFEIKSINNRLVLNLKAYHMVGDSTVVKEKTLIGKKRKMAFTSTSRGGLRSLQIKLGFFFKNRLKLQIYNRGLEEPQKLRLVRV